MSQAVKSDIEWTIPQGDEQLIQYSLKDYNHVAQAEVLERDFLHIPNALPFLGQLIDLAEEVDDWTAPTVINGYDPREDPNFRTSKTMLVDAVVDPRLGPFAGTLALLVPLFSSAYTRFVNPHVRCSGYSKFELLRYGVGDFFKEHVDRVWGNSELVRRRLTMIAFWSTDDCEGGELIYPRQGLSFKPRNGDVLIAPSGDQAPHQASEVLAGMKWSAVTWLA